MMDRAMKNQIIRLWNAMLPMEQIYQMLPCKLVDAKRYVANLREDGTLKPRNKLEYSLRRIADAYNGGVTDINELATMLGHTPQTVVEYLNRIGIKRGRPKRYSTKMGSNACDIMRDISLGEKSLAKIAQDYGVSRQYVHQLKGRMLRDATTV